MGDLLHKRELAWSEGTSNVAAKCAKERSIGAPDRKKRAKKRALATISSQETFKDILWSDDRGTEQFLIPAIATIKRIKEFKKPHS